MNQIINTIDSGNEPNVRVRDLQSVNTEYLKYSSPAVLVREASNTVTTIDPITDKRWDAFIMTHPDSTIFHHSAWARVLVDIYGCMPSYYIMENERGEITAGVPFISIKSKLTGKRLICLPRSEFCFPLAYREEDLKQLLVRAVEDADKDHLSYVEIRGWGRLGSPERLGLVKRSYYLTHTVALDGDLQGIKSRMDRNGRYNLRYAEKSPVTIRLGQDENDLKEFYRLSVATRRRLNLLPRPYHFFQSIYKNIIIPQHGFLLLAELNGKVIAANMYFCFKDTVIHEFNAQDKDYLEYRPNYLLIWKAMERSCQQSHRYYNFGRTQPENQQLANFKKHWGSEETVLPYYYYPELCGMSSVSRCSLLYRTYTMINKCLPSFMLKVAGDFMYRHMG